MQNSLTISLRGSIRVSIVDHCGQMLELHDLQPNLILDAGLNKLASIPLCDLFKVAVKGTGSTPTKELVTGTYAQSSYTVTRASGARDFTGDDVGKLIRWSSGEEAKILTVNSATSADTDRVQTVTATDISLYSVHQTHLTTETGRTETYSEVAGENLTTTSPTVAGLRTFLRTFIFPAEAASEEVVTGNYSQAGTTVTRISGARDFTIADVGRTIYFITPNTEARITSFTSATSVEVNAAQTVSGSSIKVHGYTDYTEIGFSDSATANDPVNIRVLLDTPARVSGPTTLRPSRQLKVAYQLALQVSPSVITATAPAPISDTLNVMSGNKNGQAVIEHYDTSVVSDDGSTDVTNAVLDPYASPRVALSSVAGALVPLSGSNPPDRTINAFYADTTLDEYVPGSFQRVMRVTFGLNDAIATNLRSLFVIGEQSVGAAFTWLFAANQSKDGNHIIELGFTKTWGRDLS